MAAELAGPEDPRADHRQRHQDRARRRHLGTGARLLQQARARRGGREPDLGGEYARDLRRDRRRARQAARGRRLQSEDLGRLAQRHRTVSALSQICKANLLFCPRAMIDFDLHQFGLRRRSYRRRDPRSSPAAHAVRSALPHLADARARQLAEPDLLEFVPRRHDRHLRRRRARLELHAPARLDPLHPGLAAWA